jgi:hypothetical protein
MARACCVVTDDGWSVWCVVVQPYGRAAGGGAVSAPRAMVWTKGGRGRATCRRDNR